MKRLIQTIKESKKALKRKVKKSTLKNGFYMRGRYEILSLEPKPAWMPMEQWLQLARTGEPGDGVVKRRSGTYKNLIMLADDVGLNLFIQHMNGDTTFPLNIDNASIGTGTTAPVSADTDLETPVLENIPRAIGEVTAANTWYSEWFITNDELPNGEYTEFGLKAGTQLFARSLIASPTHTKEDNEDTLIVYTITVANS